MTNHNNEEIYGLNSLCANVSVFVLLTKPQLIILNIIYSCGLHLKIYGQDTSLLKNIEDFNIFSMHDT